MIFLIKKLEFSTLCKCFLLYLSYGVKIVSAFYIGNTMYVEKINAQDFIKNLPCKPAGISKMKTVSSHSFISGFCFIIFIWGSSDGCLNQT